MASTLRKLKSIVLAQTTDPLEITGWLEAASVPITEVDCRTCANPCDEGHEDFNFDVDMETQMLGSVKPFRRQVVISTGKADWEREVTDVKGSLAAYLSSSSSSADEPKLAKDPKNGTSTPGIFAQSVSTKVSILNGSHQTISDDSDHDTVMVFPDYKLVYDVDRSQDGANQLWRQALSPSIENIPDGLDGLGLLTLPYSCVVLLCSHKRRDNRCHVAAKSLEHDLMQSLQNQGWQVDTRIEHDHLDDARDGPTSQALASLKRALIVRISHIGGHRYAGNVIINTPRGHSVWYGRVTPHDIDRIVEQTIIEGKVIPSLLRGGMNIGKPGCKSLHDDW